MKGQCKSLCIAERKRRNRRKKSKQNPPLRYKRDPDDPLVLILRNGMRIKQKKGLDLFLSSGGNVYSLTKYGLRRRRVNYTRKHRYCMLSCNGVNNGPRYPYVTFRGGTYPVHILQAEIWIGPRPDGHEIDHLNGDIDDWRVCNLQYVTCAENRRRAAILRRLRHAARTLHDLSLDPRNIEPQRLQQIFADITV